MNNVPICFRDEDVRNQNFEIVAERISDFVNIKVEYLKPIVALLKICVGWTPNLYDEKLKKWIETYGPSHPSIDFSDEFIVLLKDFFSVCMTMKDLRKMRGLIPEKIISKIFEYRHANKPTVINFGCSICIYGKYVRYICVKNKRIREHCATSNVICGNGGCKGSKMTVDVATWNLNNGEFVEIKLSPRSFHYIDGAYLCQLQDELLKYDISHAIYVITFESKDVTEERIKEYFIKTKKPYIIGINEIFSLKDANLL